jgi:large subunit ribosomal protein L35
MTKGKMKTHKGTAKRVWRTGSGKLRRRKAMVSHNQARQSVNQSLRRSRAKDLDVVGSNPRISELIPYNK